MTPEATSTVIEAIPINLLITTRHQRRRRRRQHPRDCSSFYDVATTGFYKYQHFRCNIVIACIRGHHYLHVPFHSHSRFGKSIDHRKTNTLLICIILIIVLFDPSNRSSGLYQLMSVLLRDPTITIGMMIINITTLTAVAKV